MRSIEDNIEALCAKGEHIFDAKEYIVNIFHICFTAEGSEKALKSLKSNGKSKSSISMEEKMQWWVGVGTAAMERVIFDRELKAWTGLVGVKMGLDGPLDSYGSFLKLAGIRPVFRHGFLK
ncbi:hypothetical protein SDJN03_05973, partial [Cucurbita argyrosperma subsp. sororia]